LLLNHIKRAFRFEDLRKVSRVTYQIFNLLAKILDLLGDDKEYA